MTDTKQAVRELREALNKEPRRSEPRGARDTHQFRIGKLAIELLPAVLDRLEELERSLNHEVYLGDKRKAEWEKERAGLENSRDYHKECWETACAHVCEACKILGVDPKETPADTWTLREAATRVVTERDAIRAKFAEFREAIDAQAHEWSSVGNWAGADLKVHLTRFPLDSSETTYGREG